MDQTYEAVLFDLFGTLVDERGDAIDGAQNALAQVSGRRWAIVTSCPARLARALLAKSRLPAPHVIVSSDDVVRSKPAPDCYLLAAQRLGVAPDRCLVIEDSAHGIAAGKAAGMHVVNVREAALRDLAFETAGEFGLRLLR